MKISGPRTCGPTRIGKRACLSLVPALVVVLLAGLPDEAAACLHLPADSTSKAVERSEHEILTYWGDGKQHLWLSAGVESGTEVSSLGWVIPVPTVPSDYGTGSSGLFEDLSDWVGLTCETVDPRPEGRWVGTKAKSKARGSRKDPRNLEVLETVETGPFSITPLEATGRAGAKALRKWLKENDFRVPDSTEPAESYIRRGWTFLAVRVDAPEGSERLRIDGGLPPLRISFESDRIVYPFEFEANQGEFSATMHVVTRREIPGEAFWGARHRGFHLAGTGEEPRSEYLPPVGDDGRKLSATCHADEHEDETYTGHQFYRVERRLFSRDAAPRSLANSLEKVGAWDGADTSPLPVRLHIRTLHNEWFNRGLGDASDWEHDFSIPANASLADAFSGTFQLSRAHLEIASVEGRRRAKMNVYDARKWARSAASDRDDDASFVYLYVIGLLTILGGGTGTMWWLQRDSVPDEFEE